MRKIRKICVVSSSRADYNHLYLLLDNINKAKDFKLQLVVTGMHLLRQYGLTYKELLDDGFTIDAKIPIHQHGKNTHELLKSMSKQLQTSYAVFKKLSSDIIIILGDRYDVLPVAITANIMGKPLVHIHGGEVTQGVIDDSIRHSLTKMSHIHLVATNEFKKRVVQLGENKKNIFCIGSLGVSSLSTTPKFTKKDIAKYFNIKKSKKYFIVCIHPETVGQQNKLLIENTLRSLEYFTDFGLVFSYPNSDPGNFEILNKIKKFIKNNKERSILIRSAGRKYFINLLRHSNAIIGNSSTGIVEAPALSIPTINIGDRQKGRPIAASITNVKANVKSIITAIKKSQMHEKAARTKLQYPKNDSVKKVLQILKAVDLKSITLKRFCDLKT